MQILTAALQVSDDLTLLESMMAELGTCEALYRPTHFWQFYEEKFLPELRATGLHDFRRRHHSVLRTFGATDFPLLRPFWSKWELLRSHPLLQTTVDYFFPRNPARTVTPLLKDFVTQHHYWNVRNKFVSANLSLEQCPTSYVGNPDCVAIIDGGPWTPVHLQFCSLVGDAARYVSFTDDMVLCELGTGIGRNIEVLASLFPEATFLAFDIPPQLYVANQYLSRIFGSRVVPYREGNAIEPLDSATAQHIKGRIVIQPSWRMPAWSANKIDVFWNSASFQEMEPDVVTNYLMLVKRMRPKYIYINALPGGNHRPGQAARGDIGTIEAVTERHYVDALADSYVLEAAYVTDHLDLLSNHNSYVFRSVNRA